MKYKFKLNCDSPIYVLWIMSVLFQRLTPFLASQRASIFNFYKASRLQSHQITLLQPVSRLSRACSGFSGNSHSDSKDDNSEETVKCDEKSTASPTDTSNELSATNDLAPSQSKRFKLFEKSEEELILDYTEEILAQDIATDYPSDDINFPFRERPSKYDGINLERGIKEVIDIEELVELLRMENMTDIVVLALPKELRYADYMLLANAKSFKHLEAVTSFITKVWKLKKRDSDPFLVVEGQDSPDWKVFDMGSIITHLFMPETREKYDLESLWSLGSQYDDLTQKPASDPSVDLLEKHLEYLKSLKTEDPPIRRAEMIPISVRPGTMTRQQMKELQRELIKSKTKSQTR